MAKFFSQVSSLAGQVRGISDVRRYLQRESFWINGNPMKIPGLVAMLAAAMLGGLALIFLVM